MPFAVSHLKVVEPTANDQIDLANQLSANSSNNDALSWFGFSPEVAPPPCDVANDQQLNFNRFAAALVLPRRKHSPRKSKP